jgi:hypothetical protein
MKKILLYILYPTTVMSIVKFMVFFFFFFEAGSLSVAQARLEFLGSQVILLPESWT